MDVDPYKCYKAKKVPKTFARRTITVEDRFGDSQTLLLKPFLVCNPSDKGDESGNNKKGSLVHPDTYLVCYKIRSRDKFKFAGPSLEMFNEVEPMIANFENYDLKKPNLLCLPTRCLNCN
jgi:hypothetical protein